MSEEEWVEEFARILAGRLGEPVAQWHKTQGEIWVENLDKFSDEWEVEPEEAVDEEISNWGT